MPKLSARAQKLKEERADDIRDKIRMAGHMQHIHENINEMERISTGITAGEWDGEKMAFTGGNIQESLAKISSLDAATKHRWKAIGKIIPDLKSTDVNVAGELKVVAIDMTGLGDDDDYYG